MFLSRSRPSNALYNSVMQHVACTPIVDVSAIAERVRVEHARENIAREDIELLVMHHAQALGYAMIFGTPVDDCVSS